MNTRLSPSRPRLLCRLVRRLAVFTSDDATGQPKGIAARHAGRCQDCRAHFSALHSLEARLRHAASTGRENLAPSDDLEARIFAAVRSSGAFAPASPTPAARRERRSRAPGLWIAASVAGLGVAAVAIAILLRPPQGSERVPQLVTPPIPEYAFTVPAAPSPDAIAGRITQPLQSEIDLVVADARSALRFLAINFLPTTGSDAAEPAEPDSASS